MLKESKNLHKLQIWKQTIKWRHLMLFWDMRLPEGSQRSKVDKTDKTDKRKKKYAQDVGISLVCCRPLSPVKIWRWASSCSPDLGRLFGSVSTFVADMGSQESLLWPLSAVTSDLWPHYCSRWCRPPGSQSRSGRQRGNKTAKNRFFIEPRPFTCLPATHAHAHALVHTLTVTHTHKHKHTSLCEAYSV